MIRNYNFTPLEQIELDCVGVSIDGAFSGYDNGADDLCLVNPTSSVAFFQWGVGAQTATTASYVVLANTKEVVNMGGSTHVAVLLGSAASGTCYAARGIGA